MAYYLFAFNIDTCEAFAASPRDVVALGVSYRSKAKAVQPGDCLIAYCYWPKFARWLGVLQVSDNYHMDDSPWLGHNNDPVRLKVRAVAWLPREKAVPIHEDSVWDSLLLTKEMDPGTDFLGSSLTRLPDEDGRLLQALLLAQQTGGNPYPVDEEEFRKRRERMERRGYNPFSGRKADEEAPASTRAPVSATVEPKAPAIVVPDDAAPASPPPTDGGGELRESVRIQAKLALCGEKMGFRIWLPRNDRPAVLPHWVPGPGALLEVLPLNYDANTLRTIENIDVLWIRGSAIARAFEVEHTTAVYSGLLRMADLLALQPNMRINLHIVAPEARRKKVFQEILRPVFSLLEAGPLSECCSFISYDGILELSQNPHLGYLTDSVLSKPAEVFSHRAAVGSLQGEGCHGHDPPDRLATASPPVATPSRP